MSTELSEEFLRGVAYYAFADETLAERFWDSSIEGAQLIDAYNEKHGTSFHTPRELARNGGDEGRRAVHRYLLDNCTADP